LRAYTNTWTKNGRGKYAILDIEDYEKILACIRVMAELDKGQKPGQEQGLDKSLDPVLAGPGKEDFA
jgi:hypothetical protein